MPDAACEQGGGRGAMRLKRVTTAGLLAFVAVTVLVLVLKETRPSPAESSSRPAAAATSPGVRLIAYYLHGKVRCPTCMSIEAYAKEAVETGFGGELKGGRIRWEVVDYEAPGNEHFATDYKLAAPGVVLVRMRDGHPVAWRSLPEVWELVGDKPEFIKLVQKNIRELLAEDAAEASAEVPRLLDLGATTCIPCKMMVPVLAELREHYRGRLDVVFIDVSENPDAAEPYGVETIPTQIFFDAEGKERHRHVGFISEGEILSKWKELGIDLDDEKKL